MTQQGQTPLEMLGDIQQSYVAILGTMPDSKEFAPYRKLLDQNNRGFIRTTGALPISSGSWVRSSSRAAS